MAKFLSDRQQSLRVGISSYTESSTVLQTIGNVGIGTTNAGGRSLYVIGNTEVTGISTLGVTTVTNLTSRQLNVSGISTLGVTSTTGLTAQRLVVSGISTFSNGPVLIGSATSTGTVDQDLQVTGGAYISGSVGIGTTNPLTTLQVGSASTQAFYVFPDGRVGIGQTNPSGILAVRDHSGTSGFSQIIRAEKRGTIDVNVFRIDIDADNSEVQLIGIGNQASNISIVNGSNITASFKVGGNVGIANTNPLATLHINSNPTQSFVVTSTGSVGIGTTNPTSTLSVVGNGNFSGIVSAASFFGSGQNLTDLIAAKIGGLEVKNENVSIGAASSFSSLNFIGDYVNAVGVGSTANITFSNPGFASTAGIATYATSSGIATYATSSGIATNLKGGVTGNVPYQSTIDTTTFVTNGLPGQVLLFDGTVPVWANVSAASGSGISIQDESTLVGTANSVTTLNFRGSNVVVTATTGANGIATITVADNLVGTGLSISGISTLGVTTATNLTSQQLNVSGISTLGVTTVTNLTSQRLVVSGISTLGVASITQISAGGTTGQNSYVLSSTGTGLSWQPVTSVGGGTLNGIIVQEEGSTVGTAGSITTLNFVGSNIVASAVALGATATITLSNTPTFDSLVSITGISTLGITTVTNLTSQRLVVTGISTLGVTSTTNLTSQQLNVTGISTLGVTSTTNLTSQQLNVTGISTLGVTTVTNLTSQRLVVSGISTFSNGPVLIGSATSTGTASQPLQVTGGAYVSGSIGIGTTNPTSTLSVVGSGSFSGVVTALSFSGNASSATYASTAGIATYATTAGVSTSVIGGIGSITQLQVTGISTFSNGPVLIGSATSTGTALQRLQVTGGASFVGTGASVGIGTTRPTEPLHIQGNARVTGAIYDSTNSPGTSGQVLQSTVTGTQWTTATAGSGSGDGSAFNTGITSAVSAILTGIGDTILTLPSTAGEEYIIYSIHVANVGLNTEVNVIGAFDFNGGERSYFAYNIPIPTGMAVELLQQPQILNPSDKIVMRSTDYDRVGINSAVQVYITYHQKTATNYFGRGFGSAGINTIAPIGIYTATTNPAILQSVRLTNTTDFGGYPISVTVTSGITTRSLVEDLIVPKYASIELLETPKRLNTNDVLKIQVDQLSTIDVQISGIVKTS